MSQRTVLDYTKQVLNVFFFSSSFSFFAKLIKCSVCTWNMEYCVCVNVYSNYNVIGLYERILSLTAFNSINTLIWNVSFSYARIKFP